MNRLGLVTLVWLVLAQSACVNLKSKPGGTGQNPQVGPKAQYTSDGTITTVPFLIHDNRILVNVSLNGKGPFVMIFDTGGSNIITPEVQALLQLPSQGMELTSGAGEKSVDAESVHLKSVQLGKMTLDDQKFLVLNLNHIRQTFQFSHLDGVIGYEVLQRAKVRIDFDQQVLQLVEFGAPSLAGAQTVDFEIHDQKSVIQGQVNDQPARLLIDTGDRSNLTLFRKFADSTKLADIFAKRREIITGMGVGGPIPGKLASIHAVKMGPIVVNDVLTRLPMTQKGYFFTSEVSASVGMGMLREFNLEFDYKSRRLSLQRRANFAETSTFLPVPRRVR